MAMDCDTRCLLGLSAAVLFTLAFFKKGKRSRMYTGGLGAYGEGRRYGKANPYGFVSKAR